MFISLLPSVIFSSLQSLSQCFLLEAFARENVTENVRDPVTSQEELLDHQEYNNVIEKTEKNSFEDKMEVEKKPQQLPYFVVLRQSGTKKRPEFQSSNIRWG